MSLLERLLGWFSSRAERGKQTRAAARVEDPRVALDALARMKHRPDLQEVEVDSPFGRALFNRRDVPRLQLLAKGVGERVFARAMMGGTAYGFPGGWSQDRIEQVMHLKHWIFVAIRRIWDRLARAAHQLAFVADDAGAPAGTQTKYLAGEWHARKSLGAVQAHETIIPAPAGHPLACLLKKPNRSDVAFDLWSELGLFLELTGNAYLWAVPSNLGVLDRTYKAAELWILPSHWVWPRVGKDRLIEYYEVRPWIGPGMLRFPPEDVIHLRFKSPIHKIDGFSHLTAGAEWLDTQESVNRSRFFQFKNGAQVTGNLKLGDRYVDLDDEDLERLYAKFFARFQGESNAGRTIITPPDSEIVPLTITPAEMAYVESADQLRDNILALWGVPKEVAGIQDAGSEIAMYGPMQQFAENALIPRAVYVGQVLTQQLCSRWDRRLRLWWPVSELVGENPQEKRETLKMRYDTQSITPNEIRAAYGDPPMPDGDAVQSPHPPPAQTTIHGNVHQGGASGSERVSPGANGNGHAPAGAGRS